MDSGVCSILFCIFPHSLLLLLGPKATHSGYLYTIVCYKEPTYYYTLCFVDFAELRRIGLTV